MEINALLMCAKVSAFFQGLQSPNTAVHIGLLIALVWEVQVLTVFHQNALILSILVISWLKKDLTEDKWVSWDIILCQIGPNIGPHNACTKNSDLLTSDSVSLSKGTNS